MPSEHKEILEQKQPMEHREIVELERAYLVEDEHDIDFSAIIGVVLFAALLLGLFFWHKRR